MIEERGAMKKNLLPVTDNLKAHGPNGSVHGEGAQGG
jgi:hypothetical protein